MVVFTIRFQVLSMWGFECYTINKATIQSTTKEREQETLPERLVVEDSQRQFGERTVLQLLVEGV